MMNSALVALTLLSPLPPAALATMAAPDMDAAPNMDAAPAGEPVTVRPGGVLRWLGEAVACLAGDEEWAPLDGACWYPVDLLTGSAAVTVRRRLAGGALESATVRVADYPYPEQHIELQDDSRVNLSAENAARARRESRKIGALWGRRTPRRFTLPLGPPLADLPAGGRFGARRVFNGEPRSPHTGADYAAGNGTPVLAAAAGTVVLAEEHFFAGNSVFIDHGDGLISMSFHLSEIDVADGEQVARGQRIGTVGATGRATGPHLHFGLRWRGARVDPALLLGTGAALPSLPVR